MAGKRGPESFLKRQRERQKQLEQMAKDTRRRERSAQKKNEKLGIAPSGVANLRAAPLGPVNPLRGIPPPVSR
jgi:hypothetical protein